MFDLDHISANTTIQTSNDPVKTDLELTCDLCGTALCDVEDGDSLNALASTADEHLRACAG
ncbi:hypothetical protein [Gordonia malaquae]|uniref:hypothetical protein n=1 Tax=Gordonia malaquae TaxID=410332 RepID=UPI0030188068